MKISKNGINVLTGFEGFREIAYKDIAGVWTIGYGFTDNVKPGDTITRAAANSRLRSELSDYESGVDAATRGNCTQNQFDALVSFAWNVGIAGMEGSSVIKAHKRGDFQSAARAFGLWNKAGGKVVTGLVRRRAAEAALYLTSDVSGTDAAPPVMPQSVDAEKPMTASTINRASVIAGGTAAAATVTETINSVSAVKESVDSLGTWLLPVLLLVVVCAVGYIVWERLNQRKRGQA